MSDEYTNRYLNHATVARLDGRQVTDTDGWSSLAPVDLAAVLRVGDEFAQEMVGGPFRPIVGWLHAGVWYSRKTDRQIEEEQREWSDQYEREKRERLEQNRSDWAGRTEALPQWLIDRIATFHKRGGENFLLDGWGYELAVCELAVLYDASDLVESPAVDEYARVHGTSGNQHDCAKALVRSHMAGNSLAGTVSALSPITGDAYYAGVPAPEEGR